MKALVTGATGFVGRALIARLAASGVEVVPAVRNKSGMSHEVVVGNLNASTNFKPGLTGCDAVIHLAARVHVMDDPATEPLMLYRETNTEATRNLARQAADAGVKRFVFISSIKVNGEFTKLHRPFTSEDLPAPKDPYGVSKHEAEQLLRLIPAETGMEVVIIRPPLVYGPGAKANFAAMMRWLARGVPLPFAAVTDNRRSLVALDNLVDLITTCLDHPAAANQTFLVSDGEDLSTAQLLKRMGTAMGCPARLFYSPPALLKLGARVFNKPEIYQRLCGSLQLDIANTRHVLGWTPPVTVDEGLRRAAIGMPS